MATALYSAMDTTTVRSIGLRIGLPLAFAALVVYLAVGTVTQFRKLSSFKGPLLAALSELWLLKAAGTGRIHLELYEECKKRPGMPSARNLEAAHGSMLIVLFTLQQMKISSALHQIVRTAIEWRSLA